MIKHTDEAAHTRRGDEIRLLDYAAVLLHRWRAIVGCTVAVVIIGVAIAKLSPPVYSASTVLVPSPDPAERTSVLSQLPSFVTGRMGGGSGSQKLVAGILHSRSLRDSVARRVAKSVPGADPEQVALVLAKGTRRKVNSGDGSITIEVDARDPRVAAAVAAEYPDLINQFVTRLAVETAATKQAVLEKQLAEARARLATSEQRLLQFQRSTGTVEVQEQARQGIETATALQQQILAKEVEVAQLRRTLAPGHPRLQAGESELATMRAQLGRVTAGGASGIYPGARQLPELRAQAADVLREYETNERVYVALSAELANAQINVRDDMTVLSVLDPPLVPEHPRGSLIRVLTASLLLGLVLGVIVAFVREYMARVRHDPDSEPFRAALDGFRGDMGALVGRRRRPAATP
ncbi:MAG TPA: Wzz/FepE/Etk N-terminal domain-containing protein [Longimicrobium sp.]|nr:Wzz/FepE/Etk N-terminal domain-containing protein [Longimicrobium sp.]